jgi:hypothetical protein
MPPQGELKFKITNGEVNNFVFCKDQDHQQQANSQQLVARSPNYEFGILNSFLWYTREILSLSV